MTNLEKIKNMNVIEMAGFIFGLQDDNDVDGYIGCSHCIDFNTHHSDKSLIGTKDEFLYNCSGCEYENGLIDWLNQEVDEKADMWKYNKNYVGRLK